MPYFTRRSARRAAGRRRIAVLLAAGLILLLLFVSHRALRLRPAEETPAAPGVSLLVYDAECKKTRAMSLEAYLVGVVAAEMPASFEPEALKAQAVAARTYACRRLDDPCQSGEPPADICTRSGCCQAYRSDEACRDGWGKNYAENAKKIAAAVSATAGEAIYYDGALIEALYHSSAGGVTEDAQHVFAAAQPYLVSVPSPGEEVSAQYEKRLRLSAKSFASAVNEEWGRARLKASRLKKQVRVLSRYPSGRVETLQLGDVTVSGRELRKLLGLNSANFTLSFSGDEVCIDTLGYGHGVGMSQYGANAMAQAGRSYREILTHYYPGVEIRSYP